MTPSHMEVCPAWEMNRPATLRPDRPSLMLDSSMSQSQPRRLPEETGDSSVGAGWKGRREFEILHRSRRFIGACVATSLLLAAVYNYGSRPLYEAVSVISMDQAGVSPLTAWGPVDEARRSVALQYQVGLLKSSEMALEVVTDPERKVANDLAKGSLGGWAQRLAEETRFRLGFPNEHGSALPDFVEAFRSRLSVDYEPPSAWVYVRLRGYDPEAPVLALKRLLTIYLAETRKRAKGDVGATQEEIKRRVDERQGQVVETLDKLKAFERKEGLEGVDASRDLLGKELARLQDALITARQTRVTRKALADESANLSPSEMLAIPSVREDRVIAEVSNQIDDLQARIARQRATLGDLHPEIVGLQAELALSRQRRDSRLKDLREAANRDFRMAAREETDIEGMIQSTQRRLAGLERDSVERSFIQKQAAAGQRAVGELIDRSVRQGDQQVFFEPRVLQEPEASPTPVSPQRARNFQYALAAGLLAGVLLTWLRAHLDESLVTPEDVKANFALPLLGMVPHVRSSGFDLFGPEEGEAVRLFEAYRVLRTNLMLSHEAPKSHPVILITSSRAGEGKTTTTLGLGVTMARAGLRVLLVDGDLRRASLSRLFSAQHRLGLSDAIDGEASPNCIIGTTVPGLSLLPSGASRPNPAELLNRESLMATIASTRSDYDWILFDAPPILAVADAAILARLADSVLLVIGANSTPVASVRASLEQLDLVIAKVRGLVLNSVDLSRDSHYYKYYYSAQYEDYSGRSRRGGETVRSAPEDPSPGRG